MDTGNSRDGSAPFVIETVRGEPFHVDGRKLIPLARIVAASKARATIGTNRVGGWGGGFVRITPVAIIEETADGERRVPITDATAAALRGMLGAMLAMTLCFAVLRWLLRSLRWGRGGD